MCVEVATGHCSRVIVVNSEARIIVMMIMAYGGSGGDGSRGDGKGN